MSVASFLICIHPLLCCSRAQVEVKNLSMRYMPELPLVLNNVNVHIAPRQKIGIVGRTGSGKSSFLNTCFFRLVEFEGSILIDGVDIKDVGVHDLRGRLGVIPQDPTLFSGTVVCVHVVCVCVCVHANLYTNSISRLTLHTLLTLHTHTHTHTHTAVQP
jgi:ABC-type transport system involved in Fe-S cluster assembly fused permease/ATPase subunit